MPELEQSRRTIERTIAGAVYTFHDFMEEGLYAVTRTACAILETNSSNLKRCISDIEAGYMHTHESGGSHTDSPHFLKKKKVAINFPRTAEGANGGGGGVQEANAYSLELIVEVAQRMANTPRKHAILAEVRKVYIDYKQHGFVADVQTLDTDTEADIEFAKMAISRGYGSARTQMTNSNAALSQVLRLVSEDYNPDAEGISPANLATLNRYVRMWHTMFHKAVTGKAPIQLLVERSNPDDKHFGMLNFHGTFAPDDYEFSNACNYLTNDELIQRYNLIDLCIHNTVRRVNQLKSRSTRISVEDVSKLMIYNCALTVAAMGYVSATDMPKIDTSIIREFAWQTCPADFTCAVSTLNVYQSLWKKFIAKTEAYKTNFPNRHGDVKPNQADDAFVLTSADPI